MTIDAATRLTEIKAQLKKLQIERAEIEKDGGYTHQRWDRRRVNLYYQNQLKLELATLARSIH